MDSFYTLTTESIRHTKLSCQCWWRSFRGGRGHYKHGMTVPSYEVGHIEKDDIPPEGRLRFVISLPAVPVSVRWLWWTVTQLSITAIV